MANRSNKKPNFKNLPSRSGTTNKPVSTYETAQFGYIGYKYYFNEQDTLHQKAVVRNVKAFEQYIVRNQQNFDVKEIYEKKCFSVDLKVLYNDSQFIAEWSTFHADLINAPDLTINALSLAGHQCVHTALAEELDAEIKVKIIHCRLTNHEPIIQIKQLRVGAYGKLVSVKGAVIKSSTIGLKCISMEFKCSFCNGTQVVQQADGVYTPPHSCTSRRCTQKMDFQPLLTSKHTITVSSQVLKLLETTNEEYDSSGRMPRDIECEVCDDLVGMCGPGDNVILTGVLHVKPAQDDGKPQKSHQLGVHQLVLKVNNVQNERQHSDGLISLSPKDYVMIEKVHSEKHLFKFLVQSLCPRIYGQELVKAGLVLALFGGTKREDHRRADSHVLIVGDPGLGKSQMLQACCNVSPRGIYVCGNTSTCAGLTVTMSKEASGDYRLEAGALVLADQGCCCIDEFDKMPKQHACLLEMMEQQTISIAKAGVSCSIPTHASVLAAANPANGHYNRAKTVSENLRMSSPLLSRFDLVFIIMDKPDKRTDAIVSEHVLAMRTQETLQEENQNSPANETINTTGNLKDRLSLIQGEQLDYLPAELFKKYIAYAKKYVHPKLCPEAVNIIENFYLELREKYHRGDSTPATARQFESMQRLTEARAKAELREEATADDARDVVEIMRHCIMDVFTDNLGELDFNRTQNGAGMSNQKQASRLLKVLQQQADAQQGNTFTMIEMKKFAANLGIEGQQFHDIVDSLNLQGFLLKRGNNLYHITV